MGFRDSKGFFWGEAEKAACCNILIVVTILESANGCKRHRKHQELSERPQNKSPYQVMFDPKWRITATESC